VLIGELSIDKKFTGLGLVKIELLETLFGKGLEAFFFFLR